MRKVKAMSFFNKLSLLILLILGTSCVKQIDLKEFDHILDINYTPDIHQKYTPGNFFDMGSWMGFNIPQKEKWVNGFCGPFALDSYQWIATSAVCVRFQGKENERFIPDSTNYYPGGIYMSAASPSGVVDQRLIFADATTVLLSIKAESSKNLVLFGQNWQDGIKVEKVNDHVVQIRTLEGKTFLIQFPKRGKLLMIDNNYQMICDSNLKECYVTISQLDTENFVDSMIQHQANILAEPKKIMQENRLRWSGYLNAVIRKEMPKEYSRIAVKSIVTLIANWKSARGGLKHDGIVPSYAVPYFVGFWAWDSWKHAVALSRFFPDLAKEQVRAMFDYQLDNGMVIDCIYEDPKVNNYRDSKPPLAAWAVNEIYEKTKDLSFLEELYPKLVKYYKWWYQDRDHNKNGVCEFGSTDGTIEAAAWESGMDNAIRFDHSLMVQNSPSAWSFDQESVDLNAFLDLERDFLRKFARILGESFDESSNSAFLANYFFDEEDNFFYDRKLDNGAFVKEQGSEAYIPFWTKMATEEQFEKALPLLIDERKFATYIPFPTIAADNPNFTPNGYWRGPIWLDQTYFAIKGLRNYGRDDLANLSTQKVFDRLVGLKEEDPIHENYDTDTGEKLKSPHFSWSAVHLLLLYEEYVIN